MEDDGDPEFEHTFFRPSVAAEWQALAVLFEAVCGVFIEAELERFGQVGVAELEAVAVGLDGEEHIFVEEVVVVREVLVDDVAELSGGSDVRSDFAQRKAAVADFVAGDLGVGLVGELAVFALDGGAESHERVLVEVAHHPWRADVVVAFGAPLEKLVAEDERVELGDKDVLIAVESLVELRREHQGVVSVDVGEECGVEVLLAQLREAFAHVL